MRHVTERDDGSQFLFEKDRQYEERADAARGERRDDEVAPRSGSAADHEVIWVVAQLLLFVRTDLDVVSDLFVITISHGNESPRRLVSGTRQHADAQSVAREHATCAGQHRVDDVVDVFRGQYDLVDLVESGEGVELALKTSGHGVERRGEVFKLVVAVHGHRCIEITRGNALRSLAQAHERVHALLDQNIARTGSEKNHE